MKDKIIVFEEIYNYVRPFIKWYLIRGFKIYYFRLNILCKDNRWIKKYIENGWLVKIDKKYDVFSTLIGIYPDLAYENIGKIAKFIFDEEPIIARIIKLYNDETIRNIFKKNLAGELQRFYYLNFILHNLNKLFLDKRIYFVPTLHKEGYRISVVGVDDYFNFLDLLHKSKAFSYDNNNIVFPLWFKLTSKLYDLRRLLIINFNIFGFLFLSTFRFCEGIFGKNVSKVKNYKFGVMITSPERQFANRIRKPDFLIDENKIKKEDVLFISWKRLLPENQLYLTQNNLAFVDELLAGFSLASVREVIPITAALLFKTPVYTRKKFILDAAFISLVCYAMWEGFKERYHIDNLITHCDFGFQSVGRNILLSKMNTKTWYYIDANNWPNYFNSNGKESNVFMHKYSSAHFGFLNYDYLLTWSEEVSEYFKRHRQVIRNYINIGCLWAEHIKEIENGKIKTDFKDKLYKRGFRDNYRLVSVFDSTYFDNSSTTYEDGVNFLKGIFRLLEDMPNIFVIFKEKKARSYVKRYSQEIINLLNEIERHPRCYLPFQGISPSEAIAFSELTISFPFTSPTFEALSARRKALFYDASDKFRDTFYDKIPGLVCHSYEGLFNRVKELLFDVDYVAYNEFLDEFIKGKVEPYLDCNAITRFRELLINS